MEQTLISASQMFLVPCTIFFAALGVAKTEQLKTGISLLGAATTSAWLTRLILWKPDLEEPDFWVMAFVSGLFIVVWGLSLITHAVFWRRECLAKANFKRDGIAAVSPYAARIEINYKLSAPLK